MWGLSRMGGIWWVPTPFQVVYFWSSLVRWENRLVNYLKLTTAEVELVLKLCGFFFNQWDLFGEQC